VPERPSGAAARFAHCRCLAFHGKRVNSPITAIYFDPETGTMWGGASDYGEDYGVAW
jgi:hypothetical protein